MSYRLVGSVIVRRAKQKKGPYYSLSVFALWGPISLHGLLSLGCPILAKSEVEHRSSIVDKKISWPRGFKREVVFTSGFYTFRNIRETDALTYVQRPRAEITCEQK